MCCVAYSGYCRTLPGFEPRRVESGNFVQVWMRERFTDSQFHDRVNTGWTST